MPRRRSPSKREVLPDPVYHSKLVTKFINCLMKKGEKSVAEGIFYGMLDNIESQMKEQPLNVFKKAIENAKPELEVKSRRVGGATYQVPVEIRPERKTALAVRWLISYASLRKDKKSLKDKLTAEIIDCSNGTGATIKKRDDTHKMADASKAFAHYKW